MNGDRLLSGCMPLRDGILVLVRSCACECNVSELLKLLLVIPFRTIVVSPLEGPRLDWVLDGGLLEDGRELAYVFASKVSVLLKRLIPACCPIYSPPPLYGFSPAARS